MFIELTDILRCPQPHDEAFLVLVPETMDRRSVRTGALGCPICQREYPITDGVARFTRNPPLPPPLSTEIDAGALAVFLGLSGPGGYVALVGAGPTLGAGLIEAIPAVHVVVINAEGTSELPMLSPLQADGIPIKSRNLRGVVLLGEYGENTGWLNEAARAVLPGLRVVGQGAPPSHPALEVLGSADGWYVAQRS